MTTHTDEERELMALCRYAMETHGLTRGDSLVRKEEFSRKATPALILSLIERARTAEEALKAAQEVDQQQSVTIRALRQRNEALEVGIAAALYELRAPWPGDGCVKRARDGLRALSATPPAAPAETCPICCRPLLAGQGRSTGYWEGEGPVDFHHACESPDVTAPLETFWARMLEVDDRNSPEEYPEMILVTYEEVGRAMKEAVQSHLAPAVAEQTDREG